MRIVILGAGAVGSYLAQRLSSEGIDVVVIESDPARAAESQETLDVLVIHGNGASPAVLESAGIDQAELLIAVSNNDGVNMLACHAASRLGVKRTVARVEDAGLQSSIIGLEVDVVIDPSETAAHELVHLVRQGGVSEVVEFGDGRLILVGGVVQSGSWMVRRTLSDLRKEIADFDWVVAVVIRQGRTIVATGATSLIPGDHVLMMVTAGHVEQATGMMGLTTRTISRAVILGSTRLADLTAALMLEEGLDVVIVEPDARRCRSMAETHGKALVECGSLTDPSLLKEVGINRRDAVLALSGWDERNILGCLLGRALGAGTTVTRVNNHNLLPWLGEVGIDATVSSRLAAANAILRFVRRGLVHSVATFSDTDAEAIELEVAAQSSVCGQLVVDLPLPEETVIGGILRNGDSFVPTGSSRVEAGDRLIIFALPSAIQTVETLFAG